jgi:hypothetical protein
VNGTNASSAAPSKGFTKRLALPPQMTNQTGVLDFVAELSTNLKLLIVGDSVAIQLSKNLQGAFGASPEQQRVYATHKRYGRLHDVVHVTSPVRGGGVVAGFRVTHFLLRAGEHLKLTQGEAGGPWSRANVEKLLNHSYYIHDANATERIQRFDVVVMRIPHGWIPIENVTRQALREAIDLVHELFGARKVVLLTIHTTNNVENMDDVDLLDEKNRMIRHFADTWTQQPTGNSCSGVEQMAYYDLGRLADTLLEWNARLLGYDTSGNKSYIMDPLKTPAHLKSLRLRFKIAHICAERVPSLSRTCAHNSILVDGIHLCMNTFSGRVYAGVACIIQCMYGNEDDKDRRLACQRQCNEQFATLLPVAEEQLQATST